MLDALIVLTIPTALTAVVAYVADTVYDRRRSRPAPRRPGAVGAVRVRALVRRPAPVTPSPVAPVLDLDAHRQGVRTVSAPVTVTERPEVAA